MDDSPVRISYVSWPRAAARLAGTVTVVLCSFFFAGCRGCECGSPPIGMGDTAMPGTDTGMDGGTIMPGSDASDADSGSTGGPTCGDSLVDAPEECDDGNTSDDDQCLSDCTLACGDGVLGPNEMCDVGLPAGSPGACPVVCDDGDVCTTDTIMGAGCGAVCDSTPTTTWSMGTIIGAFVDGDGCCAPMANANLDSDCMPACDNGVLELGESCEPASACPTSCDDGNACTVDSMSGSPGSCNSSCGATPIAACSDGDGCCPPGCCNGGTCTSPDADCSATCGDGVLDPLETCDPPSSCPASCDDGDACTSDQPTGSSASCSAGCSHTAITALVMGDGCCPSGADSTGDPDCPPVCGNGVVESSETCDDGNSTDGDGCDSGCQGETSAFRFSDLDVRDPHTFADVPLIGCTDVTDMVPFGLALSVNESIEESMTGDWDSDGFLDVSILTLFTPLEQTLPGSVVVAAGICTEPISSTTCGPDPSVPPPTALYTNSATTCLSAYPGTTTYFPGGYVPGITNATGPCFSTGSVSLFLDLEGASVPLQDGQVAATWVGTPATGMVNGLIRGFISEVDANAVLLPTSIPFVGGMPLSVVLPGGAGNCAAHDDRDVGLDGLTLGWWVYGNFVADLVIYSGS